jgi:phage terminase large subunit GpA-like protein
MRRREIFRDMTSALELVSEMFVSAFRIREVGGLADWMEKNITIRATENPGKSGAYDSGYTPLIPKLLDSLMQSTEWDELHVQKSSQSSLSFHALGILARKVAEDPGNSMYVIDSEKEAANISKRLTAFLEDAPATAGIMATARDDLTILTKEFSDMILWLTGAGSAGSLANKTATLGISDETDKHREHNSEASSVDLLRARLKEQTGAKLLDYSTPTSVRGQIHQEYLSGSRHKAFVPCPHCAHFQELTWERVKFGHCKDLVGEWDMQQVAASTYYECAACERKIFDYHKREMLALGEWRPTNFRTVTGEDGTDEERPAWFPKRMSAHYSDLYSQNENVSFGSLALKFIAAIKDPKRMRNFLQNHLGLPDAESAAEVTEDKILALRGSYRRQRVGLVEEMAPIDGDGQTQDIGTPIPCRPLYAALLADTQDDNSKYTIQAFNRNGDQFVIDWGQCIELEDLDDAMLRTVRWAIRNEDGETESGEIPVSVAMIDEGGHRTFEVRQFAYPRFPSVFTSRGSVGGGGSVIGLRDMRIRKEDEHAPTMPVVTYDDNTFKRELYIRQIARFDAVKAEAYGQPRLWLPMNLETSFTSELMKEKLVRQKDGSLKWNKPKGNDYGDTVKMGKILDAYIRPGLLLEAAAE